MLVLLQRTNAVERTQTVPSLVTAPSYWPRESTAGVQYCSPLALSRTVVCHAGVEELAQTAV